MRKSPRVLVNCAELHFASLWPTPVATHRPAFYYYPLVSHVVFDALRGRTKLQRESISEIRHERMHNARQPQRDDLEECSSGFSHYTQCRPHGQTPFRQ